MASFGYYALTALESIPAIVGIRGGYEQPRYEVLDAIGPQTEVRRYEARVAVEAAAEGGREGQRAAFEKLFRYITGANHTGAAIAMTTPVERDGARAGAAISMTIPVETQQAGGMRFFLPRDVAAAGAPAPDDPSLRIVDVPGRTLAAVRFSGISGPDSIAAQERALKTRIAASRWSEAGATLVFNYDPPFTIPLLRRNEVLIPVDAKP